MPTKPKQPPETGETAPNPQKPSSQLRTSQGASAVQRPCAPVALDTVPVPLFWFITIAAPLAFILVTGFIKALIRRSDPKFKDFFLSVDITLAALLVAVFASMDPQTHLVLGAKVPDNELLKSIQSHAVGISLTLTIITTLVVMTYHAQFESHERKREEAVSRLEAEYQQLNELARKHRKDYFDREYSSIRKDFGKDAFTMIVCNLWAILLMIFVGYSLRY